MPHDIFISHASADKAGFVGPLVVALRDRGVSVWYDRHELWVLLNNGVALVGGP